MHSLLSRYNQLSQVILTTKQQLFGCIFKRIKIELGKNNHTHTNESQFWLDI